MNEQRRLPFRALLLDRGHERVVPLEAACARSRALVPFLADLDERIGLELLFECRTGPAREVLLEERRLLDLLRERVAEGLPLPIGDEDDADEQARGDEP